MCGRYTREYSWREVHDFLNLVFPEHMEVGVSYNVAPTQMAPVCRLRDTGERELVKMRWGFVPSWSDDEGRSYINARSETAAISGAFRSAFKHRRLLVPASGFYEWKADAGGKGKTPHHIRLLNEKILCFAGLWEAHGGVESFAILTTRPNDLMTGIHDRMPAIVRPERFDAWLRDAAADVLEPYPAEEMEAYPVSRRVNKPSVDDAALVEREGEPGLF